MTPIPAVLYYVLLANQVLMIVALGFGLRMLFRLVALSIQWRDALPGIKTLLRQNVEMSKETQVDLKAVAEVRKLDHRVDLAHQHLREEEPA